MNIKTKGHYCVNKNPQETGEHEVHDVSCESPHLPKPENRIELGWHPDCHSALEEARRHYLNVDGCAECCASCHTR